MGKRWKFHVLQHDEAYFLHILRLGASRMLWTRTSVNRKEFRGIQNGIDKGASLALCNSRFLSEYDKGILRSVVAGAVGLYPAGPVQSQTDRSQYAHIAGDNKKIYYIFSGSARLGTKFALPLFLPSNFALPTPCCHAPAHCHLV